MTTKPSYTPTLRFPDFLNDGEWEVKRLEEISDYENGIAHENDIDSDGDFIIVNSKFISSDGQIKKRTKVPRCLAQKDDVLMVLSDLPNGRALAKCFYVAENNLYTVNQRICKFHPKNVNSKLLYYLVNRNEYFLSFDDGVKQTNLKKGDVLNCPLIIPKSIEEQDVIAVCLTSLDELLSATNEKLEQMKVYKKGLMQKLFTAKGKKLPELRFKEFEKDGEWEEKRLGDVVEIYDGIHQTPNYTKKGVMFVSVEDISTLKSNKFISEEDFFRDFKVYPQRGDILMTRIGNIGIANVYDKDELLAYYVSLALFKPKSINSYFLKQSIDSYYFQYQLSIKTLHIAFPKKINKTELESILVYCPSIPEQRKIADCLTLIDEMINQYTNKVAILELYKKGLMQQMFPNSK